MESKLEAEREQWNMHRCWGILLLLLLRTGGEGGWRGERESHFVIKLQGRRHPDADGERAMQGGHIAACKQSRIVVLTLLISCVLLC